LTIFEIDVNIDGIECEFSFPAENVEMTIDEAQPEKLSTSNIF